MFSNYLETPIGLLEVLASSNAVTSIYFVDQARAVNENKITETAIQQLIEYFRWQRTHFDLPLHTQGTEFQERVWHSLSNIEYAGTRTYSEIANSINNPKGVRAVGLANSKNPMTVVVPCHRVIAKSGKLAGYAGGVERKAWLLKHEQNYLKGSHSN